MAKEKFHELGKQHTAVTDEILDSLDVLVDGPFIEAQKDISLPFRGSRNQRIIDMPEKRQACLVSGNFIFSEVRL